MPLYAAQTGATVTMLTHPGCDFPALSRPMARKPQCARFYADASAFLLRTLKPGDILFLPSLRIPARAEDAAKGPPLLHGAKPEYLALSRRLVATGARLVIEAPTPVFDSPPFRCLDAFNRHNPVCRAGFEVDRSAMEKARQSVLGRMHRLAGDVAGVEIWDPLPILCPGVRCSALRDGRPLYLDTNHLNYRGHMLLYPSLRAMLRLDDAVSKRGRQ